jgi:hypothetical protein
VSRPLAGFALLVVVVAGAIWALDRTDRPPEGPVAPHRRCGVALGLFASTPDYDYAHLLDEIADHGATDVLLSVPWVQPTVTSSHLAPRDGQSPSSATLDRTITQAHDRGLAVSLMPVVRLETVQRGVWRGALQPEDRTAWFTDYTALMLDHADRAERLGATRLVLGSELSSLEGDSARWTTLITTVRTRFSGRLTWSANWDRFEDVPFWHHLDEVGVSAWFEVGDTPARGWQVPKQRLQAMSRKTGKPILLTEVGYPARSTAADRPWDHQGPATPDLPLQARLFEAFFAAFHAEDTVHDVFIWNWFGIGGQADAGYTPRGRPAAAVIKRAYTQWCPPT